MSFLELLDVGFLVAVVLVAVSLFLMLRSVTRGQLINFSRVQWYFEGLLADGQHLDALIFSTRSRRQFLLFRKVVDDNGEILLQLSEPSIEVTQPYWRELQELINRFDLATERDSESYEGEATEIMRVRFGNDIQLAERFVKTTFTDLFDVREGQLFLANLQKSAAI